MRLCGSDVISCEPSLAPTASIEAYLGEHGGFGGSQTSDESPKQTGQDRSNRGASFANEVDHEVADEETARFRLGRDQGQIRRSGSSYAATLCQSLLSDVSSLNRNRCAPFEQL